MSGTPGLLVAIGVGNVLLRDDGAGVRVIEALERLVSADPDVLPAGTRLVDGGTLGLGLLGYLDGARGLVIVDASETGEPPGTVSVDRAGTASEGPVGELLAMARLMGTAPVAVATVGIAVGEIGVGTGLTPAVAAAVPVAAEVVAQELAAMTAPAGVAA